MIIGICGLIGAGKDTVANQLINNFGFTKESFANPVKDITSAIFNWPRKMLEGDTVESRVWRETEDEWWTLKLGYPVTPRKMLQVMGTEVMRKGFYDGIWVASLEKRLQDATGNTVISDCRFPNEIAAIKSSGGKVVRVVRGPDPAWYHLAELVNPGPANDREWLEHKRQFDSYNVHPSEYSWVGTEFDYIIENNGTLDDLKNKVLKMMSDF